MTRVLTSVEVAAPIEDVFDFITDPRNNTRWQRLVIGVDVLEDGPPGPGMHVVEHRRVAGRVVAVPFTVTDYQRPTLRAFEVTAGPLRPQGQMRFEALSPGRTRVEVDVTLIGRGPARLLTALAAHASASRNLADLQYAARLIETDSIMKTASITKTAATNSTRPEKTH